MGLLLMLATLLAAGAAIIAAVAAGYFHLPGLARATQIGLLTWAPPIPPCSSVPRSRAASASLVPAR